MSTLEWNGIDYRVLVSYDTTASMSKTLCESLQRESHDQTTSKGFTFDRPLIRSAVSHQ